MKLRGRDVLTSFLKVHANGRAPLDRWVQIVLDARWTSFAEVRQALANAEQFRVGRELVATVFNIGGNKYRLIAEVVYAFGVVEVLMVLRHAEYSKDRWKDRIRK